MRALPSVVPSPHANSPFRLPPPSFRTLFLLTLLSASVAAGITAAILLFTRPVQLPVPCTAPPSWAGTKPPSPAGALPPRGELVKVPIVTQKPDEFIDEAALAAEPENWHFQDMAAGEVKKILVDSGMLAAAGETLVQPETAEFHPGGQTMRVPDELILGMSAPTRKKIYSFPGKNPQNNYQKFPFTFLKGRAVQALGRDLQPATRKLVLDMMYVIGNTDCFADIGPVLRQLADQAEQHQLIKQLTRQESLLLKLKIQPDSDVIHLLAWWGKGGRRKDLHSLLESLTSVPGGTTIDAAHLMPGFARRRLYTFPDKAPEGKHGYDCHYSSLNFFLGEPDNSFLEPARAAAVLAGDYESVSGPGPFGDLILLTDDGVNVVHSCVYIADDVVFTKNGTSEMQPWLLMTLEQVEAAYPSEKPWGRLTYRLKEPKL